MGGCWGSYASVETVKPEEDGEPGTATGFGSLVGKEWSLA